MIYLFVYLAFILIVTQALLGFELLQPLRGVLLAATVNHHKQSGEQSRGGEQETATEREVQLVFLTRFLSHQVGAAHAPRGGGMETWVSETAGREREADRRFDCQSRPSS